MSRESNISQLGFYATPPHECSYLPDRQAVTLFADPQFPKDHGLYATLSGYGFRRSGEHLYRPRCTGCNACIPVRIPVNDFQPRRSQKRVWQRNRDLSVRIIDAGFNQKHFELFERYVSARHTGGGMDNPTTQTYMDFLISSWSETLFAEIRDGDQLIAVAVVDQLEAAMSAVYTFFDPEAAARSPGVFAILWQIEEARQRGLEYIYLGYWIRNCQKMSYKIEYQPMEYYRNGNWFRIDNQDDLPEGNELTD